MSDPRYVFLAIAAACFITVALRAIPFALLRPLRESEFVQSLGKWMPVGIMGILAVATFLSVTEAVRGRLVPGLIAVAVTIVVHLAAGRRTLLSIAAGTAVFVVLLAVS